MAEACGQERANGMPLSVWGKQRVQSPCASAGVQRERQHACRGFVGGAGRWLAVGERVTPFGVGDLEGTGGKLPVIRTGFSEGTALQKNSNPEGVLGDGDPERLGNLGSYEAGNTKAVENCKSEGVYTWPRHRIKRVSRSKTEKKLGVAGEKGSNRKKTKTRGGRNARRKMVRQSQRRIYWPN